MDEEVPVPVEAPAADKEQQPEEDQRQPAQEEDLQEQPKGVTNEQIAPEAQYPPSEGGEYQDAAGEEGGYD